jgi:hypothetical protein
VMKQLFKSITIEDGETTKKIYINVNLIESIIETPSYVHIRMQQGSSWLTKEPLMLLLDRLQSK